MEVVKHKTVNRAAPVPVAAAHPVTDRMLPGTWGAMQLPSPSTRRFADSGILGKSKVSDYLAMKGEPVRLRGNARLKKLRENEQKHDTASEKLSQTQNAVVVPSEENQSAGNIFHISQIDGRKVPAPTENRISQQLQSSISANIPQTIEDVDNFKSDNKASQMREAVLSTVQEDKNAVVSTFADLEHTPKPAPPVQVAMALPAEEKEPATPEMNLGQGAIAPLLPEHTDVSNYTKEADARLKEEGITQEQLDMVDSGDLAVAGKEKKVMEKMANSDPQVIQNFARLEGDKVDIDLKKEEKTERDKLKSRRKNDLGAARSKQLNTKNALEKQRLEVAGHINSIFQVAQKSVEKKLSDLETKSMKSFDDGSSGAASLFEERVKSEMNAFKSERYKGLKGKFKKAKDWLLGMKDLPDVKAIFDRNRALFVTTVNKLIAEITAANKRVIGECKAVLGGARKEIAVYVAKLAPALKETGTKAAQDMNGKLAGLDSFIEGKEHELQQKLADKQVAAIRAIDERIEKMKETMSGALSKIGNLLLQAAKKFFAWALKQAGYSLSVIEGVINRGTSVLKSIFTQPVQFAKQLIHAAVTGFKNFGQNFLLHLKNSLFEWLTGSLEGLVLPRVWDLKGIVGVALQMIGISYQHIRQHMVAVMGETIVGSLEKTFTLVRTLITEGPMAAWEQLKEMAGEVQQSFIEAVKDFLKIKVIEQAIQWVVSIFVPGAGIVKAVIAIYDTIVFFVQKAKQIMQMISSFLGSVGEIAAGNIGAAASALENGLARGLTLVIGFLAQLLHLNAITDKIKAVIQKIRGKVDAVLAKVAKWIADKAKSLFGKVKEGVAKVLQWWKMRLGFTHSKGEKHTLAFQGEEDSAKMVVESKPVPLKSYLADYMANKKLTKKEESVIQQISEKVELVEKIKSKDNTRNRSNFSKADGENIQKLFQEIAVLLGQLKGNGVPPPTSVQWEQQDGEDGIMMVANPLSINPGGLAGSQPREESKLWKAVNKRYPGEFVQGHLLNHHVHGPGIRKNLIPITRRANSRMERWGESLIKKAVLDDNRTLRFLVKVSEFQGAVKGFPEAVKLPKRISMEAKDINSEEAVAMPAIPSEGIESKLPE